MYKVKQVVVLLLVISMALPATLRAQLGSLPRWAALNVLQVDDPIELRMADAKKVHGNFLAVEAGALSIRSAGKVLQINAADVMQVDRLQSHVGRATAIGAAIGAAGGAVAGAAGFVPETCFCSRHPAQDAAAGAILFAIPGAIAGLATGLLHHHRELIYLR